MSSFLNLIKERRSASNFLPNHPISKEELNEIFEYVKLAPSAFNLQHTHYISVLDESKKAALQEAAYGQHKVKTASAVIVVTGNKEAYREASTIYEGLHLLGQLNKQEYDLMVNDTLAFYETRGDVFKRDETLRNGALSAMLFMLVAKEKGWDTCPMIGFDNEAVKKTLSINDQSEVIMMITIGKEKTESRKPRGYRKPVREFVSFV